MLGCIKGEIDEGNFKIFFVFFFCQMSLLKRTNNIQFVCIPNPPIPGVDGPVTMLVKVKNADMANELETKMNERLDQEK
jgi:hypothetical protein